MSTFMLGRRDFLKAAAAGGFVLTPVAQAVSAAIDNLEETKWCACVINCGQRCPVRCITKNGQVICIETDNTSPDNPAGPRQIRACQRGRSMRERIYSPDRLKYPMKRVGKRGEGKFERISWDEATDIIAKQWKRILDKYGPESVYWQYCSGQQSIVSSRRAWQRLMNLNGGYLKYYGSYSNAQLQESFPLTYGSRAASLPSEIANASLYVLFGNNFSSTRPSGSGKGYQIDAAMDRKRPRTIVIDPCYTDTAATHADQWIPIRPGTDAALVGALAYEFIRNGWIDQKFLDTYCVGFDAKTLPASAPKGSDYRSYILGEGPDRTPKTPEWASRITGIPVETIKALAKELGTTKPFSFPRVGGRSVKPTAKRRLAPSPWFRFCSARSVCPVPIRANTKAIRRSRPSICLCSRIRSRLPFRSLCGRTPFCAAQKCRARPTASRVLRSFRPTSR